MVSILTKHWLVYLELKVDVLIMKYSILVFDREGARSGKTMKNGQTDQIRTSSNIRNKNNKTKNSEEKIRRDASSLTKC